jgi:hypothetical protein
MLNFASLPVIWGRSGPVILDASARLDNGGAMVPKLRLTSSVFILALLLLFNGCKPKNGDATTNSSLIAAYPTSGEKGLVQCNREVEKLVQAQAAESALNLTAPNTVPLPTREQLVKACMILNDGESSVLKAWNGAPTEDLMPMPAEDSHSYGLTNSTSTVTQFRDFLKTNREFFAEKIRSGAQNIYGWGVGFSLAPLIEFGIPAVLGLEAMAFRVPNDSSGGLVIAYYGYSGAVITSPVSGYVTKAFGCEDPISYNGWFLTGPFFGMGINFKALVSDLASGTYANFLDEAKRFRAAMNPLLSAEDLGKLSNSNLREYLVKNYASSIFMQFLTLQLNFEEIKEIVKITVPIFQNWRNIIKAFTEDGSTTALSEKMLSFLRTSIGRRDAEFPVMTRFLKSADKYFTNCDALSFGPPDVVGVTYYTKFAEMHLEDYDILETGKGFRDSFDTAKALRLIRAFAFFTNPVLLKPLMSHSAQLKK